MDDQHRWVVHKGRKRGKGRPKIPVGDILKYFVKLQFPITNNEVEHESLITKLKLPKTLVRHRDPRTM